MRVHDIDILEQVPVDAKTLRTLKQKIKKANNIEELKAKFEEEKESLAKVLSPYEYEVLSSYLDCVPITKIIKCGSFIEGEAITQCENYDNISFEYSVTLPFVSPVAHHSILPFQTQQRLWVFLCQGNVILSVKSHLLVGDAISDKIEFTPRPFEKGTLFVMHFICSGYNGAIKSQEINIQITKISEEELIKKLREGKEELRKMKIEDDSMLSSMMGMLQNNNNDENEVDEEEEQKKQDEEEEERERRGKHGRTKNKDE